MSFEKEDDSGKSLTEATKLPEQGQSWPEARCSRCVRRSQWPSVCPRGREEAKERMSRKAASSLRAATPGAGTPCALSCPQFVVVLTLVSHTSAG